VDYYPVQDSRPATVQCAVDSAVRRNVPANVLLAILEWENGHKKVLQNPNGTVDIGQGGINSIHLKELHHIGVSANVVAYFLKNDGCYSADFSAYLLQKRLTEARNGNPDFWTRVASYHSKTPSLNVAYQQNIRPLASKWAGYLARNYTVKDY